MDNHIRSFRDFLQIYNSLSETCFKSCVDNFNSRILDDNEAQCAEDCAQKFITLNHRFMSIYVESQQLLVNKRTKDAEEQEKLASKEEVVNNSSVAIDNNSDDLIETENHALKVNEVSVP